MIPGGDAVVGADDFSDGESTPLTQDYGDRYVVKVSLTKQRMVFANVGRFIFNGERERDKPCLLSFFDLNFHVFWEKL